MKNTKQKGDIEMNKMMRRMREKKGFTLAELLIVVAIIAVLVAIAIPVFSTQLEKSREATDLANIRAGYAQLMTEYLEWDGKSEHAPENITVPVHQTQANWQNNNNQATTTIADAGSVGTAISVPAKTSGSYTIHIDTSTGTVTVS